MIANGIFMSHLIYLMQLWGGCSSYLIDMLQILQNRAARYVTKLAWRTPTSELLKQCNWLSVRQMIIFYDLLLVFKIRKEQKPVYLFNKLSNQFSHNTRNAKNNKIKQSQIPKSDIALSSFVNRSIVSWNNLPNDITNLTEINLFKRKLKNWVRLNI